MPFETLCPLTSWGQCSLELTPHSRHEKHAESTANTIPVCDTSILGLPLDFSVSCWWTYCAFSTLKLGFLICKWKKKRTGDWEDTQQTLGVRTSDYLVTYCSTPSAFGGFWWHLNFGIQDEKSSTVTYFCCYFGLSPLVCSVSPMGRPLAVDMESLYEAAAALNNTMSNFKFWTSYSDSSSTKFKFQEILLFSLYVPCDLFNISQGTNLSAPKVKCQ